MNPIDPRKLQHTFSKHAQDFGIVGNWNTANGALLEQAIVAQVADPNIQRIQGTYRGSVSVIHYFDSGTGLNVMVDLVGDFIAGWKLSPAQISHLLTSGNVQ